MTRKYLNSSLYLTFVLGFFLWLLPGCQKSKQGQLYTIAPPLKGVDIKPDEKTIDPTKTQLVRFAGGTQVEVPANAFVDDQGKIVKTPVKLSLEVYDTPAKILASGIPMTFDDGETKGDFESAGMFQLTGKSEEKKVSIAKDKSLMVNYPSKVAGDDFDFFYFEEQSDSAQVTMAQVGEKRAKTVTKKVRKGRWKKLTNETKKSTLKKPKTLDSFRLKFKKDSFPELADLETINWPLATQFKNPKDTAYQWVLSEKWTELELSQPKYILGNPLEKAQTQANSNHPYKYWWVSTKGKRLFLVNGGLLYMYNEKGGLIRIISAAFERNVVFRMHQDKYFSIWKKEGVFLYDFDGKQIGFYSGAHYLFEKDLTLSFKNNRVAFQVWGDEPMKDGYNIKLTDLSGKVIKKMKLTLERDAKRKRKIKLMPYFELVEAGYLITSDISGVKVYDLNGRLVAQKPKKFKYFDHFEGTTIFLYEYSGQLLKWDFIKNQELLSSKELFNLKDHLEGNEWNHRAVQQKIHQHPILALERKKNQWKYQLWNYQTNQVVSVPFMVRGNVGREFRDTIAPHLIAGYKGSSFFLYNTKQQKTVANVPGYDNLYRNMDTVSSWPITPYKHIKLKRVLLNSDNVAQMRDFEGKLIFDFKKYDSTSFLIGFTKEDYIFSISKNGIYRKWDANGQLLASKIWTRGQFNSAYLRQGDQIAVFSRNLRNLKLYDLQGNFLLHPSRRYHYNFVDSTYAMQMSNQGTPEYLFYKLQKRPPQVYQLTLHNLKKEFVTYVSVNDARTQQILAKYRKFRARKLTEETDRQHKEAALMRTFKIKKFGLYNWDVLLQAGRVQFAASFDFQQAIDYNDVVVYLLSRVRGQVVLPFSAKRWKQFSIDPKAPNRLVAVLPKNKLAVFSQADIDKVDWQKIKATKKYEFKMRIVDDSVENLEALTKAIQ